MKKRTIISIIITLVILGLTNKFWLLVNSEHFRIYFLLLVIISVLSYLMIYKLTSYLADFKTIKNKSRIEIIFLTIFFIFLFIPMSYINQDKISKKENRTLATWKSFIQDKQINYNFGKDFNEWFNDRFNLRSSMIKAYNFILAEPFGVYSKGFYDKGNGMLYRHLDLKAINMPDIDTRKCFQNLVKLNEFCNNNNIKLYIIITPQKSIIHKPTKDFGYNFNDIETFKTQVDNFTKESNVKIIYPIEELQEGAKDNFMFFQTEHHWTDDATFITYKSLIEEIQKDFPQVKPLQENDFDISYNNLVRADWNRKFKYGTTCNTLGISRKKKYHKVNYRYFTHKQFDKLETKIRHIELHRDKTFYYPNGTNLRVLEIGNSQNENMSGFIPFTFKNVKYIRVNNVKDKKEKDNYKIMKYNSEEILEYKPDIMIFCFSYYCFPELKNLFDME